MALATTSVASCRYPATSHRGTLASHRRAVAALVQLDSQRRKLGAMRVRTCHCGRGNIGYGRHSHHASGMQAELAEMNHSIVRRHRNFVERNGLLLLGVERLGLFIGTRVLISAILILLGDALGFAEGAEFIEATVLRLFLFSIYTKGDLM